MSFLTTQPEALTAAASDLQGIGSVLAAQNTAAAAPTTGVTPAGTDEVSALMAAQFSTHGSMYQSVSAQAAAIHEMLVHTLSTNAQSYAATEAANAAASTPAAAGGGFVGELLSALGSNSTVTNFGGGMSTAMMYIPSSLLPSMIGFLAQGGSTAGSLTAGGGLDTLLAPGGALGALGGLGGGVGATSSAAAPASAVAGVTSRASLASSLSGSSSWAAATSASAATPAAVQTTGWTVAPESSSVAAMPGGMSGVGTGRGSHGFGVPRYGSKPTVMPRPAVAG